MDGFDASVLYRLGIPDLGLLVHLSAGSCIYMAPRGYVCRYYHDFRFDIWGYAAFHVVQEGLMFSPSSARPPALCCIMDSLDLLMAHSEDDLEC